ncbi:methenyltetrahydrofolate synthase domain-containing protein-like isoform X2 [Lethenteron reissneri]|uniref:methenyltetrahydrofolate synthase domain-containing protein-like isoform X2 n=1 Tax=Lethenteron reissneri TaxID=7753 RepID=UPI002AB76AF2|nr:methenyltetrahydrofolate synthase domain-containing protein-like isoform X2 [Lethenteron reissneri]
MKSSSPLTPPPLGTSKWDIRQTVWDYMELHDLANFPRPVHHRIPNFKGSYRAAGRIGDLAAFAATSAVKVDPDKPLEGVRLAALEARKTLLVPTPRLRSGLFNRIVPPAGASKADLHRACASSACRSRWTPACASTSWWSAPSPCPREVVDIPEELVETHDLTVDYILTPTRVIKTNCSAPKPRAIIWSKIDRELLARIPILNTLRAREERLGRDVSLRDAPSLHRTAASAGSPDDPSASLHRETVGVGSAGTAAATRVRRAGSVSARGRRGDGRHHRGRGGGWARQPIGGGGSGCAVPDLARGRGGGGGDGM